MSTLDETDLNSALTEATTLVPYARTVWEALEAQHLRLCWVRVVNNGSTPLVALRVQTPERLQRNLGLSPELLFLVAGSHIQAAHTRHGIPSPARDLRTDPFLAFWSDPHAELSTRLDTLNHHRQVWVPFTPGDDVVKLSHQHLAGFDAFAESGIVTGQELIGREADLGALRRDLQRRPAIGLFGLRRVGKTSLVLGLRDQLLQSEPEQWHSAYVDVQAHLSEGPAGVWRDLAAQLGGAGSRLADVTRGLQGQIDRGRRPLVILDEYDWLFAEPRFAEQTVQLLGLIRGHQQRHPGATRWILVGRAPTHLNGAQVGAFSNPTLNYWHPFWVRPLDRRQAGDLLKKLGRRMSLDVGHRSKDEAYRLTQGHPNLTRQFGSHLAALTERGDDVTRNDQTDSVVEAASRRFSRSPEATAWVAEVENLLRSHHPASFDLLRARCSAGSDAGAWPDQRETVAADILVQFGLVDHETGTPPGLISDRLRARPESQSAA